jgi:phenylacetate-CoA ligase
MIRVMELARKLLEFRRLLKPARENVEALQQLRERKLRALVRHVYATVPYYRSLFEETGVDPGSIRRIGDLERIPITTKNDLRRAGRSRTLAAGVDPESCLRFDTTGSTGEPFPVLVTRGEVRTRLLIELRGLYLNGLLRPRERRVVLGPEHSNPQPLYQRLGLFRRDHISPWLPIDEQIARLRALRPDVLWAYPTALRAVLERLGGRLSTVCQPRALITSAEPAPDSLLRALRADLDIECFDFYAAMEAGRIGWECRAHAGLHLNADSVILELVDAGDALRTVVVTALDGRAMPFLRYRLDDLGGWAGRTCPCGLPFPLFEAPQGRVADLVRLPGGRTVPSWTFDQVFRPFDEIERFRVQQESLHRMVVQLALRRPLAPSALDHLRARLRDLVGESVHVDLDIVDDLPREPKSSVFASRL